MEQLHSNPEHEYFNPALDQRQQECLDILSDAREEGVKNGYLNWATGTGKTDIAARDVNEVLSSQPDARILFLCHDTRILDQTKKVFVDYCPELSQGDIYDKDIEDQEQITFASFQKLRQRYEGGKLYEVFDENEFDYIIVDESHHGPAETYEPIISHFKPKFLLGLTATPDRRDQRELSKLFGPELDRVLLEEAIAKGYLASVDYRVFTEELKNFTDKELQSTELSLSEIADHMFQQKPDEEIVRQVKEQIREHPDPRTVVFCRDIKTAKHFAKLFAKDEAFGSTAVLHSQLHPLVQDMALEGFRKGEADTIVVVNQMNEGVDVPEANVAVFLRATESLTVYLQQLGRILRGKDSALVLDFVANWERIKFAQHLQNKLQHTYSRLPYPHEVEEPFAFNFSENTIKAISAIERARDHKRRKIEPEPTQQQIEDKEIEKLLGTTLPRQGFLARSHEQFLLKKLQQGDKQAEKEYIVWRSRTAYNAIKSLPEMNGLMIADYFQIGCETLLEEARNLPANAPLEHRVAALTGNIQHSVHREIKQASFTKLQRKSRWDAPDQVELKEVVENPADSWNPVARMDRIDMIEGLRDALENLSYRERRVLELHYGLGEEKPDTLDEVARTFNVTGTRIHQIKNQSIKKLQALAEAQKYRYGAAERIVRQKTPIIISSNPEELRTALYLGFKAFRSVEDARLYFGGIGIREFKTRSFHQALKEIDEERQEKALKRGDIALRTWDFDFSRIESAAPEKAEQKPRFSDKRKETKKLKADLLVRRIGYLSTKDQITKEEKEELKVNITQLDRWMEEVVKRMNM